MEMQGHTSWQPAQAPPPQGFTIPRLLHQQMHLPSDPPLAPATTAAGGYPRFTRFNSEVGRHMLHYRALSVVKREGIARTHIQELLGCCVLRCHLERHRGEGRRLRGGAQPGAQSEGGSARGRPRDPRGWRAAALWQA